MNLLSKAIVLYLVLVNLIAFALYGIDKRRAKKHQFRIPEKTLLWMARTGGGIGCWLGIKVFHHKTMHTKFRIIVPLWTILWVVVLVFAFIYWK